MNKSSAVLSILLILVQPAFAAPAHIALPDKADTVIVPEAGGLKFSRFEDQDNAVFSGKLTLSGTYYYGDNAYNDDPKTVALSLYFVPDAQSVALLPYLQTRGKAGGIFLTNDKAFAQAVLTKAQLAPLSRKGAKYASGHVSIVVDTFQAGLACDVASFSARFVSLAKPGAVVMAEEPGAGC